MAPSIAPVEWEPWHSRGVRKINIYYRLDDSYAKVYILNVIYAKRDQLRALKKMNLHD